MKVSYLSPVHNEERHLATMLQSLVDQSDPRWEILIVDDGSTDQTRAIIDRFADADHRIVPVGDGRKIGKVAAFNRAFAASTGEVIAISGGDDLHPPNAVQMRLAALERCGADELGAAFFKLLMFHDDGSRPDVVLPRGTRGSRSGPSLTLTRALAQELFPIPETLVSEDIWLGEACDDLARTSVDAPEVVVRYRVHAGNSNPRNKPFDAMSAAMHARAQAWELLLEHADRLHLSDAKIQSLRAKLAAEGHRYQRRVLRVLMTPGLPLVDRLGVASMSRPALWRLRTRYYTALSGWRRW